MDRIRSAGSLKFWLAALGWAAIVLPGCQRIAPTYCAGLGQAITWVVNAGDTHLPNGSVHFQFSGVPYDLGIFAALCLGTSWVGWTGRLRALAVGAIVFPLVHLLSFSAASIVLRGLPGPQLPASAGEAEMARILSSGLHLMVLVLPLSLWMAIMGNPTSALQGQRRRVSDPASKSA